MDDSFSNNNLNFDIYDAPTEDMFSSESFTQPDVRDNILGNFNRVVTLEDINVKMLDDIHSRFIND